ncbi:MAG: hypothetical protein K2P94_03590 [Rhodospirillaceae bacterium]|nr:hypothetical protein [Rhodospirillaceae bacterium]
MTLVIIVGCVILWAVIQRHLNANGIQPRSRGSLRYQRRKARKLSVDVEALEIQTRYVDAGDLDEIRAKVDRFARKWLLIPTIIMAAMILWPFLDFLWK